MQFLNHIYLMLRCFGRKIHHLFKDNIFYRKKFKLFFFQNRNALTDPLFKNAKILKFRGNVALENCILIRKYLHKTLPKILCDWFTLSFESHAHSTRWASNGCINLRPHLTKSYGRYSVTINAIYIWNVF